jgi:hypothetical protein
VDVNLERQRPAVLVAKLRRDVEGGHDELRGLSPSGVR